MEENKKTDLIFPNGLRFFKPRDNAPKSIKGNMVINILELREFMTNQGIEETELLRVDLRKSETKGTYYFTLNTWKPEKPKEF